MFTEFCFISSFQKNLIFAVIFFYKCFYITWFYILYNSCDLIYRISIYFPSELNLCFYFIALCYSNISHIVGNTHNTDMAAFNHADCCTHPRTDSFLCIFILPISHYNLAALVQTCENVSELTVSVCCLIFIHEIHIDCIVWNLAIKLCMEMKQRFSQLFQSKNP